MVRVFLKDALYSNILSFLGTRGIELQRLWAATCVLFFSFQLSGNEVHAIAL